jgi:hypothetical protein
VKLDNLTFEKQPLMKTIFTACISIFGILVFSQEAGKAGEFLKNEASQTEMRTQNKNVRQQPSRGGNGILDNSGYRNPNSGGGVPQYNWRQNFGYSEVFLRIPEMGYFTVEIGNQMMSNDSGKFRFFDLNAGKIPLSIYRKGYLVYRTQLNIRNNTRLVLDYFTRNGLYLLDSYPVQNQYGFSEWDDVWNNPYANGNFGNTSPYQGNVMNDTTFASFLNAFKNNSFDSNKIDFVQSQLKNTMFTSQQIATLMKMMSFDENRLQLGKILYGKCSDRQNFFVVYKTLDFESNRKELMKYVANSF